MTTASKSKTQQLDVTADQLERGIGIKCPRCGSNASREGRPAVAGRRRYGVQCLNIDCDWFTSVEVDAAGDVLELAAEPYRPEVRSAQPGGNAPPRPRCRYPGCTLAASEGGLCDGHRAIFRREAADLSVDAWLEGERSRREQAKKAQKARQKDTKSHGHNPKDDGDRPGRRGDPPGPAQSGPGQAPAPRPAEPNDRGPGESEHRRRPGERDGEDPGAVDAAASPTCRVDGCERPVKGRGACSMHYERWKVAGRPKDVDAFFRGCDPNPRPRTKGRTCDVPGCEDKHRARGLCMRHLGRWETQGRPDLATFKRTTPAGKIAHADRGDNISQAMRRKSRGPRPCRVDGCERHVLSRGACSMHYFRWINARKPDAETFFATTPAGPLPQKRKERTSEPAATSPPQATEPHERPEAPEAETNVKETPPAATSPEPTGADLDAGMLDWWQPEQPPSAEPAGPIEPLDETAFERVESMVKIDQVIGEIRILECAGRRYVEALRPGGRHVVRIRL